MADIEKARGEVRDAARAIKLRDMVDTQVRHLRAQQQTQRADQLVHGRQALGGKAVADLIAAVANVGEQLPRIGKSETLIIVQGGDQPSVEANVGDHGNGHDPHHAPSLLFLVHLPPPVA